MKIVNCKVNHIENPLGFRLDTPVFSFITEEAEGKKQEAARILVTLDPEGKQVAADTGMCSGVDSLGTALKMELAPRTRYYWRAAVRSELGEEAVSGLNWFETGKMDEAWQGRWISCKKEEGRHPVFGRAFSLSGKEPVCARLYICGLGLYSARINGSPVTEERLTPYSNDYNSWIQYQTYDVSALLKAENHIEVLLGNGWYKGRFGFTSTAGDGGFYGDSFLLIAELRIRYADGSEQVIGTDEDWQVSRSCITFSNIYDGEHRDDTLAVESEGNAFFAEAPKGKLTERLSIPVLVHEELKPVSLIHTPAGEYVYDLGQNMAGIFRLHVHEPAGTVIHVQVGEVLQEGNFYRENLRSALAEYYYTSDGTEKDIEPVFTFYGYRYAKVEGLSSPALSAFTGLALYSDITPVGTLKTGHEKINQLLSNIAWGQKGNFVDVPTDCPQRDERMGWTADTQVFVPTACYLTDSFAFYRKFLYDMRLEQKAVDGMIPNVIPSAGMTDSCSSVWGDAATIIPWFLWLYYGDRTILAESFDLMKDWTDWITRYDGDDHAWGSHFHFGDWLALDNPAGGVDQVMGGTDEAFIAYVYYYNSALLVEKAARVLGRKEDEEKYHALAQKVLRYVHDEYYTPNGRCAVNTQTGNVLSIWYDLTEDPGKPLEQLLKLLKAKKNKLQTGFVGTPMLSRALSKMGQDRLAYTILKNEEFPGWLYEINLGATTVWERWNSMDPDGRVSSTGMNSFNHYAYGSIGEWMWQTIAGISPCEEEPGFRRAVLRPVPDYSLQHAEAVYHSPAGTWRIEWEVLDADTVRVLAEVPFNCTGKLLLPWSDTAEKELEPGTYEFICHCTEPLKKSYSVDSRVCDILDDPEAAALVPDLARVPGHLRSLTVRQAIMEFAKDAEEAEARLKGMDALLKGR